MFIIRAVAVLFALLLSASAWAQEGVMRPGLWEFSMSGMPMKQTVCITPDMAKDVTKMGRDNKGPQTDCNSSAPKVSGKTTTFTMSCTKPTRMNSKMTLTSHNPDSFTMTQEYDMEMDGQRQKGSTTMNYKRLGECRK